MRGAYVDHNYSEMAFSQRLNPQSNPVAYSTLYAVPYPLENKGGLGSKSIRLVFPLLQLQHRKIVAGQLLFPSISMLDYLGIRVF